MLRSRQTSITVTIKPSKSLIQEIYLLWNNTVPQVSSAPGLTYTLSFQAIPVSMLEAGALAGGNIMGVDASEGPLAVLTVTTQYTSSSSDTDIETTTQQLSASIQALASKTGDLNGWIYLNYADESQGVVKSYGRRSVERMRAVSARVDPLGLFQKAQPGGFKL